MLLTGGTPGRRRTAVTLLTLGAIALGWRTLVPSEPSDAEDAPRGVSLGANALFATGFIDLTGRKQSFAQWQGKVLVINFWATWCEPCRREIPSFVRIQRKFAKDGVIFVGVAIDSKDRVADFVKSLVIDYPILLAEADGMSLAARAGDAQQALPFTAIVDRTGEVVRTRLGVYPEPVLERSLRALTSKP